MNFQKGLLCPFLLLRSKDLHVLNLTFTSFCRNLNLLHCIMISESYFRSRVSHIICVSFLRLTTFYFRFCCDFIGDWCLETKNLTHGENFGDVPK